MNPKPSIAKRIALIALPVVTFVGGMAVVGTFNPGSDNSSCISALDDAIEVDGYMVDALDASGRASKAALNWDSEAIDNETDYIKTLVPDVQAARASFDANSDECRAGS